MVSGVLVGEREWNNGAAIVRLSPPYLCVATTQCTPSKFPTVAIWSASRCRNIMRISRSRDHCKKVYGYTTKHPSENMNLETPATVANADAEISGPVHCVPSDTESREQRYVDQAGIIILDP